MYWPKYGYLASQCINTLFAMIWIIRQTSAIPPADLSCNSFLSELRVGICFLLPLCNYKESLSYQMLIISLYLVMFSSVVPSQDVPSAIQAFQDGSPREAARIRSTWALLIPIWIVFTPPPFSPVPKRPDGHEIHLHRLTCRPRYVKQDHSRSGDLG